MTNDDIDKIITIFRSCGYEPDATIELVPENLAPLSAGQRINAVLAFIESFKTPAP